MTLYHIVRMEYDYSPEDETEISEVTILCSYTTIEKAINELNSIRDRLAPNKEIRDNFLNISEFETYEIMQSELRN